MNLAVVPHATSVAACALLGERRRGLFRADLALRMQQLVDLLRIMDVRLTPALLRDEGDFSDSIASLLRMDLIRAAPDARGEILFFEPNRRRALDIYRNSILHYLAAPSFLALELLRGGTREEVLARLYEWLDVFHGEFFRARGPALVGARRRVPRPLRALRLDRAPRRASSCATEAGAPHLAFLAELTRAVLESYYVAVSAVAQQAEPIGRRALERRIARAVRARGAARRDRAARGEQPGDVRQRGRPADPRAASSRRRRAASAATAATRCSAAARPGPSSRRCASVWRPRCAPGRLRAREVAPMARAKKKRGPHRLAACGSGCRRAASRPPPRSCSRWPASTCGSASAPTTPTSTIPTSSAC